MNIKSILALCILFAAISTASTHSFLSIDGYKPSFESTGAELEDLDISKIFSCIQAATALVGPFTKLIKDIKENRRDFETINGDITGIFSNTNAICSACGIPQPKTKTGPVDIQKCILDADIIAKSANNIIQAKGNFLIVAGELQNIMLQGPTILEHCGIHI